MISALTLRPDIREPALTVGGCARAASIVAAKAEIPILSIFVFLPASARAQTAFPGDGGIDFSQIRSAGHYLPRDFELPYQLLARSVVLTLLAAI